MCAAIKRFDDSVDTFKKIEDKVKLEKKYFWDKAIRKLNIRINSTLDLDYKEEQHDQRVHLLDVLINAR